MNLSIRGARTGRTPRRILAATTVTALAATGLIFGVLRTADAATVGAGSYTTTRPAGAAAPTACGNISANPRQYVTGTAPAGAVPTNDWWSSLLFKRYNCAYSDPLHAHPMSFQPIAGGLGVSYTTEAAISGTSTGVGEYHYPYTREFTLGVAGLNAPDVKVDGWTDWTVSPYWSDGARTLRATVGHGLPFVYAQVTGGNAELSFPGTPTVWHHSGTRVGFSMRGHDYVAYGPSGATWSVNGTTISSTLAGRGYFSVALLPTGAGTSAARRTALMDSYGRYAHAHVTGTRVSWSYDQASSTVDATYSFTTTAREGSATGTVVSLYPHQWKHLDGASPIAETYVSARGPMRNLVGATSFRTAMRFHGVLPEVPAVATSVGADLATLTAHLDQAASGDPLAGFDNDTYWTGKALGRAARLAEIADQLGRTAQRDHLLTAIRNRLTDWFTASPGKTQRVFFYDQAWGTLVGYPASYGSDTDLNDHHFHYGYYIAAAATLAKFDPTWAATSQYGGMVNLLIRDANSWDRNDPMFPFLRDFDIYAGHDWAAGHGAFFAGNNQESSSEGMNFANALIQWGLATGNTAIRDAGLYIYTTQSAAIQEYWFDSSDTNFPASFGHRSVGMVWGDGGAYATWFSAEPEMIQGINMLPVTGGSLYLGYRPDYIATNWNALVTNNGGPPTVWQDILWSFQALGDANAALTNLRANPNYPVEEGESRAHTFHWVRNLAALGRVDTGVTANTPLYAVFDRNGARTYVASNFTSSPVTVTFSDGTRMTVPAGQTATTGAHTWSGGTATGTPTSPNPSPSLPPTPPASPTPDPTTPPVTSDLFHLRSAGVLSNTAGTNATTVTVPSAGGANYDGTPHNPVTFRACGLTGAYRSAATTFDLQVDAGTSVGAGIQARVSYDFTGSGSYGRTETYHYFATDPVPGTETYRQSAGLRSASGEFRAMSNGCVRLELWNAIGNAATTVRVDATSADTGRSTLRVPFRIG
ncbi:glycosyl hydrolase [Solwaraspora sp. WMMA2080]|uniref:glycosyl hydrolase n=1 Tax=unclassified Solwaraspora TaxID=2627926 RepID=UPI00248C5D0D|nr:MULTISPECIES: glycosyl hydrolase [unclassified Solwaraspora]WBB95305.1 glycosyl hydrolase [Solwaraspora sp. WMMA2059]WBC20790.1 glycosyl hydrolase [Solwaraspora sp. WMMA2080]